MIRIDSNTAEEEPSSSAASGAKETARQSADDTSSRYRNFVPQLRTTGHSQSIDPLNLNRDSTYSCFSHSEVEILGHTHNSRMKIAMIAIISPCGLLPR